MDKEFKRYYYSGPVYFFDHLADEHWEGETVATSIKRAESNLKYQWKKQHGFLADYGPVILPNSIIVTFDYSGGKESYGYRTV